MKNLTWKKHLILLLILPLFTGLLLTGCDDDNNDSNNGQQPPPQAQITIRTEPDPVPYSEDSGGRHYWKFTLIVEETGGVGATLLEWVYDMYKNDDTFLGSDTLTVQNFIDWLDDCDAHTEHIEANSKVCSNTFSASSANNEEGWYIIMKMRFRDDNGNEFWAEGRVTLLPIP